MIIKGKSRAGPQQLAKHLGNAEKNEKVKLVETRGTVAQDLRGALVEMDAYAVGTRCEKPLYHAAISPEPPHRLTDEQRSQAIDALEEKLGLTGHARVVVMHEKLGRQHIHVVWSRIDLDRMRSVSDSHNYRKHEEVARDLERRFGHDRVQGAHHDREGVERPERTPSRAELQQQERTGITGKMVKAEVTAAFRASDGPEAFRSALEERGYILARGDRRDHVIIDPFGGIHSLARRIEGVKVAELREFMAPIDKASLPSIEEAREIAADRVRRARERLVSKQDNSIEKAYARGDDYVSQTQAALKDDKHRQKKLRKQAGLRPKRPAGDNDRAASKEKERAAQTDRQRRQAQEQGSEETAKRKDSARERHIARSDNIEVTEAKKERIERLLNSADDADRYRDKDDWPPDRQREVPGGGRTRNQRGPSAVERCCQV